jgi:hypothetical protein
LNERVNAEATGNCHEIKGNPGQAGFSSSHGALATVKEAAFL